MHIKPAASSEARLSNERTASAARTQKEITMGIAGAGLLSLILLAGRELVLLSSQAKRALLSVWRWLGEGRAHGASLHATPPASFQQSDRRRVAPVGQERGV